jgi:NTE family protein
LSISLAGAEAPPPTASPHPRIGLVLEGGAALGLAHIGVIQWLEEHHIPVSYVAGTSMGGLVGGLYATGHSPEDMQELIEGIDWNQVLKGQTPFADLSYRRKEDERDYPNSLEFGIRKGLRFPEGFNGGHQVGLILDRIALPYAGATSFDELPIPFACVATDLTDSSAHVFRSGSLALALRSTMSLPGIFNPVRSEGHVFVDGGLLDNLPVDVAQQMGADFVIAVNLQTKSLAADEALSSFGVLGRSISTVIAANENRSKKNANILINVPLAAYAAGDYEKGKDIAKAGYAAAEAMSAQLLSLRDGETAWKEHLAAREARKTKPAIPRFLEVTGTAPPLEAVIRKELAGDVGKPVDANKLDQQLTQLTGVGRFSRLGYHMVEQDGQPGLQVIAEEKQYGPPIVRPLLILDGSQVNNTTFTMGARITFLDIGGFGSEIRNDISVGTNRGVASEYFHPLGVGQHWFVAPQGFASENLLAFYANNTLTAQYQDRLAGGAFDLGYQFGRTSELRVGYEIADRKTTPQIGDKTLLPSAAGRFGTTRLRYSLIDVDNAVIPRNGIDMAFRTQWFDASPGSTSNFPVAEDQLTLFKRLDNPSSILLSAFGGTTFGHDHTGVPQFSLGGPHTLAAYGANEILTNQYYLFRVGYLRQISALPPLLGDKVYFYGAYEAAKAFDVSSISKLPMDGVGAVVVNTIFGPVAIGGSIGDSGHRKFFFELGRLF